MTKKKILIVDDEKLIRWSLRQRLSEWGLEVAEAENARDALRIAQEELPDMVMLDMRLPDASGLDVLEELKKTWPELPIVMITAYGVIDDAVAAMRKGAYDFITKPIDYAKLSSAVKNALESASLKKEIAYYKEREEKEFALSQIVAVSLEMKSVLEMVKKIAASEVSIVLLQGESGTGKDVLAHAIHGLSRRKEFPFLAVNCSAIPENLLESELFGFEKGAFTDAKQQKKGLVETAEGGTVFFDEISTLGLHLQAKLLRFLETQSFKRVGGLKDIEVDLRVLAATNQDLEGLMREGKFRSDLFYRLNVCPISLPPLRKRREDILPLVNHFIGHFNIKFRKNISRLSPEAEKALILHDWPGNVRELRNAVERAMIFEEGPVIQHKHLPIPLGKASEPAARPIGGEVHDKILSLPETEKTLILRALKESGRNQSRAARLLDISRDTLRYKIKKFKIQPEDVG